MPRALRARPVLILLALLFVAALAGCQDEPQGQGDLLGAAEAAQAKGLYLEAEGLYEQYLAQHTLDGDPALRWEAWNRLVDISMAVKGDMAKAQALLEAMRLEYAADPASRAVVLDRLGDVLARQGRWRPASEAWQEALASAGPMAPVTSDERLCGLYVKLGRAHRQLGQFQQAKQWYQECGQTAPTACRFTCRYEQALNATLSGDWQEASEELEGLLAEKDLGAEDRSIAAFLYADALEQLGRTDQARQVLQSILNSYPNPEAVRVRMEHMQ